MAGKRSVQKKIRAYSKIRKLWKIKPVTKVKQSEKVYLRPREKRRLRRELKGIQ